MAAIRALEARSREFMREKQEKKRLEERVAALSDQIVAGGGGGITGDVAAHPGFRSAIQEAEERMRGEYEFRLAEAARERDRIEEEQAQVGRFKQLLLKQREIMILLTARLNERDEALAAAQEEIDAYDAQQRVLEDRLERGSSSGTAAAAADGPDLQKAVEALRADRDRLARELETVHEEKSSLEVLLREKLERMVQGEIEARLALYRGGEPVAGAGAMPPAAALVREREIAAAELARAREEISALRAEASAGAATTSLVARVEEHANERRAIQSIMEKKVKSLVDAVAVACADPARLDAMRLARDVQTLQRLVNASVAAMRNSKLAAGDIASAPSGAPAPASVSAPAATSVYDEGVPAEQPAPVPAPTQAPKAPGPSPPVPLAIDALLAARKQERGSLASAVKSRRT